MSVTFNVSHQCRRAYLAAYYGDHGSLVNVQYQTEPNEIFPLNAEANKQAANTQHTNAQNLKSDAHDLEVPIQVSTRVFESRFKHRELFVKQLNLRLHSTLSEEPCSASLQVRGILRNSRNGRSRFAETRYLPRETIHALYKSEARVFPAGSTKRNRNKMDVFQMFRERVSEFSSAIPWCCGCADMHTQRVILKTNVL